MKKAIRIIKNIFINIKGIVISMVKNFCHHPISALLGLFIFVFLINYKDVVLNITGNFSQSNNLEDWNGIWSWELVLFGIVVIIPNIIIHRVDKYLNRLSSNGIGIGLHIAFSVTIVAMAFLVSFLPLAQRKEAPNDCLVNFFYISGTIFMSLGVTYFCIGICNLTKNFLDWITAKDISRDNSGTGKVPEEIIQRSTITLTVIGLIVALFK